MYIFTFHPTTNSVRGSLHDARMAALQADQERANMLSLAAAQRAEPAGPSSLDEAALLPPAGVFARVYCVDQNGGNNQNMLSTLHPEHTEKPKSPTD